MKFKPLHSTPFAPSHRKAYRENLALYKAMIRQSKANKWLGRVEKGVHLLEKGVAVAHGLHNAYKIGQAVVASAAPLAAAML